MTPYRKAAIQLALRYGIPISHDECWNDDDLITTPWDGNVLHVSGNTVADLFHDIAHWLCATTYRRKYKGFGLGNTWDTRSPLKVSFSSSIEEETCASVIGILFHHQYDPLGAKAHAEDHSWGDELDQVTPWTLHEFVTQRKPFQRAVKRLTEPLRITQTW